MTWLPFRLAPAIAAAAFAGLAASSAWAADDVTLFKLVTVKDEIVIGLTTDELAALPSPDAGGVAAGLSDAGELTAWRYAVGRAADGALVTAPLARVGLLAHDSLRVEPYASEHPVIAPAAQ